MTVSTQPRPDNHCGELPPPKAEQGGFEDDCLNPLRPTVRNSFLLILHFKETGKKCQREKLFSGHQKSLQLLKEGNSYEEEI